MSGKCQQTSAKSLCLNNSWWGVREESCVISIGKLVPEK